MAEILGLPPRKQRSEAEAAEAAMRELEFTQARDAQRQRQRNRLIGIWMGIHAACFLAVHALITWTSLASADATGVPTNVCDWLWLLGSAPIGAGVSWLWWRMGDWRGGALIGAACAGWLLICWMLGWCHPFGFEIELGSGIHLGGIVIGNLGSIIFGTVVTLAMAVLSPFLMSIADRETM